LPLGYLDRRNLLGQKIFDQAAGFLEPGVFGGAQNVGSLETEQLEFLVGTAEFFEQGPSRAARNGLVALCCDYQSWHFDLAQGRFNLVAQPSDLFDSGQGTPRIIVKMLWMRELPLLVGDQVFNQTGKFGERVTQPEEGGEQDQSLNFSLLGEG